MIAPPTPERDLARPGHHELLAALDLLTESREIFGVGLALLESFDLVLMDADLFRDHRDRLGDRRHVLDGVLHLGLNLGQGAGSSPQSSSLRAPSRLRRA